MTALNHVADRFIVLPFRRGEKDTPDWEICWKYIQTHHSSNATTGISDTLKSMNDFHNTIVKTCTDDTKHVPNKNFIELTLKKYCRNIAMVQAHLPLHEKLSGKLKFIWKDSFDESQKYQGSDANLELVSCIYNMAAAYDYVGVSCAQSGAVEEIKDAFNHFQNSAGYYCMVEQLLGRLPSDQLLKGDMRRDSLDMLKRLTLAQAHHVGYLKAEVTIKDKHDMLSKIAMTGAKMYEEVIPLLKNCVWRTSNTMPWKSGMAKEAEAQLVANKVVMEARAHLHLALKNEAEAEMGVAIAYYIKAKEVLRGLPKMQTNEQTTWVNSIVKSVNAAHDAAEKSNNSVYYARVPKEVPAPECLPRPLGQATEHESIVHFTSKRGDDPFFGIVPAHIATKAAEWRDQMRKKANVCGEFAKTQRRSTQDSMQKLGVSAAIQTLSGDNGDRGKVPEPLRSKILAMRGGQTGKSNQTTETLMNNVKVCEELNGVCTSKLKEIEDELAKDKVAEKRYIDSYGEKMWRSMYPAAEHTADYNGILASVSEHRKGLQQWLMDPLAKAKKVLNDNMQSIVHLDLSMQELDALMPYSKTKESRTQSEKVNSIVEELKKVMERQSEFEDGQKKYLGLLQDTIESDDIINGLSSVEPAQRDTITQENTKKINDIIEEVNKNSRNLAQTAREAEEIMGRLGQVQSADPQSAEIQKVSNTLENACSMYTDLLKDFESIVTYGSKAVDNIENTLSLSKSFTLSRQLEAEETQSRLDAVIAQKMNQMSNPASQRPSVTQPPQQMPPGGQRLSQAGYQGPPAMSSGESLNYTGPPGSNYSQRPSNAGPDYSYQPQQYQAPPQGYNYPPQQPPQGAPQGYAYPPAQQAPPQSYQYPPQQQQPPQQNYDRPPSYDAVMGGQGAPAPGYQYPPPGYH